LRSLGKSAWAFFVVNEAKTKLLIFDV